MASGAPLPPLPEPLRVAVLRAELHAASLQEALAAFNDALEQLGAEIKAAPAGSPQQAGLIGHFKLLLERAEALKQSSSSDPSAAELSWRQGQARHLAQQAVAADARGESEGALASYFKLLEVLNRCHALETEAGCRQAIMARFQVYLERAEALRAAAKR